MAEHNAFIPDHDFTPARVDPMGGGRLPSPLVVGIIRAIGALEWTLSLRERRTGGAEPVVVPLLLEGELVARDDRAA